MRRLWLVLLSGVLFGLSLPPFDLEWLGWVAFSPLLLAANACRPLEAMGLGMIGGIACGILHARWHPETHSLYFAYLPFIWLAMVMGVVAGIGAILRQWWNGTRWVLLVAAAGVTAEWLTAFSPLPIHIALSQHRAIGMIQIASWTGIWGISFLLWLVNAAITDALLLKRWRTQPLGMALGALALASLYSAFVLRQGSSQGWLRVAAIQDHTLGETGRFLPSNAQNTPEGDREDLTRQAAAQGAKLIVWSEGCLGAYDPEAGRHPMPGERSGNRFYLVAGYSEPAQPKGFNAAALIAPDGRVKGIHRKIHLFLGERMAVQAGHAARSFDTGLGKVGMEICYDSCFTDVTRRIVRDGAQVIAMPNYDPPVPRGVLHRLHAALLPFRAVENRIPFVRSDSNGLSQIIDSNGRIIAQGPLFAPDVLVRDISLGSGRGTLFTRLGDWFAYLCLAGVMIGVFAGRRVRETASPLVFTKASQP